MFRQSDDELNRYSAGRLHARGVNRGDVVAWESPMGLTRFKGVVVTSGASGAIVEVTHVDGAAAQVTGHQQEVELSRLRIEVKS